MRRFAPTGRYSSLRSDRRPGDRNAWSSAAGTRAQVERNTHDHDIEDKIAYVVANPVAAGLVEQPERWPGVLLWNEKSVHVSRPNRYFREDGTCPAHLELRIERPAGIDSAAVSCREWRDRVDAAIARKVIAAHRCVRGLGRAFLGRSAVLAASFAQRARTYEVRFGVIPTFAAKLRAVRESLRRVERAFRWHYRRAFERWQQGERAVRFPAGTWGMVATHGAMVGTRASSGAT